MEPLVLPVGVWALSPHWEEAGEGFSAVLGHGGFYVLSLQRTRTEVLMQRLEW